MAHHDRHGLEGPWPRSLPTHWTVQPVGRLFTPVSRPVRPNDAIVTAFRDGVVTLRARRRTDGFRPPLKAIGYHGVRQGDLVIHTMDAFAGAVGVSDADGKVSPSVVVCRPRERAAALPLYYQYVFQHLAQSGYIAALAKGVREHSTEFTYRELARVAVPVPPITEQAAIAARLTRKTATIDRLRESLRRLQTLLESQRQAFVVQTVAHGLDDQTARQATAVSWLDWIPAHWAVVPLTEVALLATGDTPDKQNPSYWQGEIPWVSLRDGHQLRRAQYLHDTAFYATAEGLASAWVPVLPAGTVILSRAATVGLRGILKRPMALSQHFVGWTCHVPLWPEYLYWVLECLEPELHALATGTAVKTVSVAKLRTLRIPLPPLAEQQAIANRISRYVDHIRRMQAHVTQALSRWHEYRVAVVAQGVVGRDLAFPQAADIAAGERPRMDARRPPAEKPWCGDPGRG